jgi:hypothetical protein
MKDTPWDHGLRIAAEADGLVGHAGAVLLRKLAGRAGLTGALGSALARAGKFPVVERGVALVSMAVAIALGATSMTDITLLAHRAPVLGAEPSDTTVRRTLELANPSCWCRFCPETPSTRDRHFRHLLGCASCRGRVVPSRACGGFPGPPVVAGKGRIGVAE